MLSFKPTFSLSSFTFIKRLFSSSSLSAIRVGKAMTNLDSVLKSKDITLLTNVHIVKAIVLPVIMYKHESWTVKKAEC